MVQKELPTNTIIIRQNDRSKSVYFIKSGKVNLLRKIDFTKSPEEEYDINAPKDQDYSEKVVESKLLEINELGAGDWFGDDSLLSGEKIQHSVVTSIPTEIFVLD